MTGGNVLLEARSRLGRSIIGCHSYGIKMGRGRTAYVRFPSIPHCVVPAFDPKLLRDGWKPVRSSGERGFIDDILQASWVEVSNCSGTGLGFCTFGWKRRGQCARVVTYGEFLPERGAPKSMARWLATAPRFSQTSAALMSAFHPLPTVAA